MKKSLIVLDKEQLLTVERICLDKEEELALDFIRKVVAPQIKKEITCMSGQLMRGER